jgi:cell division protein FtsW
MPTRSHQHADYGLLALFGTLLVFGLIMLASASTPLGFARFDDQFFFLKGQIFSGVIPGLIAFFVLSRVPYQWYQKMMWPIFGVMCALLIAVFIPGLGSTNNTGTHSWLNLGFATVQPSEFAKLGLVLFFAALLTQKGSSLFDLKSGFIPVLALGMVPILFVILQPDIGTVSILFSILFGMLFLAGAQIKHLAALAASGAASLIGLVLVAPYRAARLTIFLHPELDPQGIGYHINQAFLAVGSGGFFGLGLGHSRQKFQYLPEVHADSIFAIIAEEMGFLVAAGLILLFVLIAHRGLRLMKRVPDRFGQLIIGGILLWFLVQAMFNIAAIIGLMPLTGVPLPFVSHGGTALMIAMAAVGIIMNVSKHSHV